MVPLLRTLLLFLLSWPDVSSAEESPVRLHTHIQAPYQVMEGSRLGGSVTKVFSCIFQRLNRPYILAVSPRKRNRELLKNNKIDGFFLNVPDEKLDIQAVATKPIALERWKYYRLKSAHLPEIPQGHQIGTVLGSNEESWVRERREQSPQSIPDIKSLVRLLEKGRINYALADAEAFENAMAGLRISDDLFESRFVRYVPLVAYFSSTFNALDPEFIQTFNRLLEPCIEKAHVLKQHEIKYLTALGKDVGKIITADPILLKRYGEEDGLDFMQRHVEDETWKEAINRGKETKKIEQILGNDLSKTLREMAGSSREISEIFMTDDKGFIIAMNAPTSDYWQGDEIAYRELFINNSDIYVSPILFDHSTRKFQTQVSLPLLNKKSGQKDYMLTIGFDVTRTFGAEHF